MKEEILNIVFNHFIDSSDFNGILINEVCNKLNLDFESSIFLIKTLVEEDKISIQKGDNPFIISLEHLPLDGQMIILDNLIKKYEKIKLESDFVEQLPQLYSLICLYPSQKYLKENIDSIKLEYSVYDKRLALGEPQFTPVFFDIEVLDKYFRDPRYKFNFKDYSGYIYYLFDEVGGSYERKESQIYLKSFGLGYDDSHNRVIVVYLRYLNNLSKNDQLYWKSKEISKDCKVVSEYYNNIILGSWSSANSIFSAFLAELECINSLSEIIFSKKFFKRTFSNENRPKEFTFFFMPTKKNYKDFVELLYKMISDNINKSFFEGKVELYDFHTLEGGFIERKQRGTLRLFKEWLTNNFQFNDTNDFDYAFSIFNEIRKERNPYAHSIEKDEFSYRYIDMQKNLMHEAYRAMRYLRIIFSMHPAATNFKIPEWLEKGKIKSF